MIKGLRIGDVVVLDAPFGVHNDYVVDSTNERYINYSELFNGSYRQDTPVALKPFMMVEIRDGRILMVSSCSEYNNLVDQKGNEIIRAGRYKSDFTNTKNEKYDIMKVYGLSKEVGIDQLKFNADTRDLLWERETPKTHSVSISFVW